MFSYLNRAPLVLHISVKQGNIPGVYIQLLGCYLLKRLMSKNGLIYNPPLSGNRFVFHLSLLLRITVLSRDSQPNTGSIAKPSYNDVYDVAYAPKYLVTR